MYQYFILPHFKKQLKPLCKKYHHLKGDLMKVLEKFDKLQYQSLGGGLYKIRIGSQDIQRGKSKSFRLILFVIESKNYIVPIMIYYRGQKDKVLLKEINKHLEIILFEARFLE